MDEMLPCKLCQSKPVKKAYWNCPNVECSLCETLLNANEWNILMSDSRRPELDEEELIPFLLTLRTFYNKDGDVDLTAIAKSICANFTAPEAKQREVKWPEKVDLTGFKDGYGKGSRDHIIAAAWNQAIDACKKAYEEAQPASSVNAEVVEALRGLVDDEECSFDHHGYCQTHFSGSMPCLMEKARKALKKVGYD